VDVLAGQNQILALQSSYPHHVRSAPDSDRTADIADWQLRAKAVMVTLIRSLRGPRGKQP